VGDLEDLDRRRPERNRDISLGVAREKSVERAVRGEQDDTVRVRILGGEARVVRPEDTDAQPSQPIRATGSRGNDGHPPTPGLPEQLPLVHAVGRLKRVEHLSDRELGKHLAPAPDVIPMRMRGHKSRQPTDSEPSEQPDHVRLRRPLVDEHSSLRDLEQDRVALADVEHRQAESLRRREGVVRSVLPGQDECERHCEDGRGSSPSRRAQMDKDEHEQRSSGEQGERADRRRLGAGQASHETCARGQVGSEPPVRPGERSLVRPDPGGSGGRTRASGQLRLPSGSRATVWFVSAADIRKRQADLRAFVEALGRFLATMERHETTFLTESSWTPRPGQEAEATRLRLEVDRLAGRAAYAIHQAGVFVDWKPRGTFQTQPVNPAIEWGTILDWDPKFPVDAILSCAATADGILDMQIEVAEGRESRPLYGLRSRLPRPSVEWARSHARGIVGWAAGVAGLLVVAFLTDWFGWS
jgi:hypothetical protein